MFNVGSVQGYLKLNTTGWDTAMGRANASLASLSRTMMKFGALTTGSLLLIEREFGKFDKAIRHATSVSEVSEAQFKQMGEMALDASVQWNKAAADTAQAFYYLGSAGLSVTEQMQAFNDTIMLSRAMGSELSQTVEGLVDIVRAFGLEFANTKNIADQLTKTVISSNQHFSDLDKALAYAGATAAFTNNTLAETNAMLGVMANAGIKGSMAGTVLRRALANLVSPTTQMASLLYKLGMNIYDSSGKMKPFIQIVGEMGDKMQGTSEAYRNMVFKILFGVRAIGGQIQLFNYGSQALRKYADEIKNATGVTEKVAGKQMKAFTEQLGQLWREIQRVAIELGEKLAPAIERVADRISYNLEKFREYVDANSEAVLETMKWVTAIGAAALVFPPLLLIVTSLTNQFTQLILAMGGATTKMLSIGWKLAGPYAVILSTIYLIRALLQKEGLWDDVVDFFTGWISTVIDKTKSGFKRLQWIYYRESMLAKEHKLGTPLVLWDEERTKAEYARFEKAYNKTVNDTAAFLGAVGKDVIVPTAKDLGNLIAGSFTNAIDAVEKSLEEDLAALGPILEKGLDVLGGVIPKDLQTAFDKLTGALAELKNMYKMFQEEPGSLFNELGDWLEEFDKKVAESAAGWKSQFNDMGKAFGKTMGVIETAWTEARQAIFNPVEGAVRDWGDMFIDVLTGIQSGWQSMFSNILNDTYDKARTIENVLEDMFLNILHQFNNLLAEVAARSLLDVMFKGKMERQAGTPTFGDLWSMLFPKPEYYMPGLSLPTSSQSSGEWQPSTPQLGFQSGKIAVKSDITINNNATNTEFSAKKSAPQFNGREWVVNTMIEAYDTDPNVRSRLGGK